MMQQKRARMRESEVRKGEWNAQAEWDAVCRRNAGRRRYNCWRAFRRAYRRTQVAKLLLEYGRQGGLSAHGCQARIARALGVSQGTISRDVQALTKSWRSSGVCPLCGSGILLAGEAE